MIAPLNDAILSELDRAQGGPVQAEDPRTHAPYVVIPRQAYLKVRPLLEPALPAANGGGSSEWTDEKNERRWDLIDREIARTITLEEAIELEELQGELSAYLRRVAPLPIENVRQLHDELLAKAAAAQGPG